MITTLVRFRSADDLRLDGLLFEPNCQAVARKIVIQVHGTASTFYTNKFIGTLANEITKSGWAFVTFNNRGAGLVTKFYKEENDKIIDRVAIGSKTEIFEECLLDIQGAIDFAKQMGYTECDMVRIDRCARCYHCASLRSSMTKSGGWGLFGFGFFGEFGFGFLGGGFDVGFGLGHCFVGFDF